MKRPPPPSIKISPEQVDAIETAVFDLLKDSLDPQFYLLDVSFTKEAGYWYLQVFVEGVESRISLDQCAAISTQLNDRLEAVDALDNLAYQFEVSSPGLFRPIKKCREFDFFKGRAVRVETVPIRQKFAKSSSMPAVLAEGVLQEWNADRQTLLLRVNDNSNEAKDVVVVLDSEKVVFLNPDIQLAGDEKVVSI